MTEGLLFLIVIIWLGRRQLQERPLKISRIWIVPVLMIFASARLIGEEFFATAYAPLLMIVGFLIGAFIGVARGKLTQVRINTATGEATVKGSIVGFVLWIVLFGLKLLTRNFDGGAGVLTGALLCMGVGTVVFRRVWIYLVYMRQMGRG